METLDGVKVADARYVGGRRDSQSPADFGLRALFVEPKWAQFLQSSGVTEAMGRPMPLPEASPSTASASVERVI